MTLRCATRTADGIEPPALDRASQAGPLRTCSALWTSSRPTAGLALTRTLLARGQVEPAVERLRALHAAEPGAAEVGVLRAQELMELWRADEALDVIERVPSAHADHIAALCVHGAAAIARGSDPEGPHGSVTAASSTLPTSAPASCTEPISGSCRRLIDRCASIGADVGVLGTLTRWVKQGARRWRRAGGLARSRPSRRWSTRWAGACTCAGTRARRPRRTVSWCSSPSSWAPRASSNAGCRAVR